MANSDEMTDRELLMALVEAFNEHCQDHYQGSVSMFGRDAANTLWEEAVDRHG